MNEHDKNLVKDNFIGWISDDGLLEVVGIADEVGKYGRKLYKVTCKICEQDPELFPEGYFVTYKHSLLDGSKPCGCSKYPKWNEQAYKVKLERFMKGKSFIIHGFIGDFVGKNTRVSCECLIDKHRWTPKLKQILTMGQGCPKCHKNAKPTEKEALDKCKTICDEMNYEIIGFPNGYKNKNSKFEYICNIHGKQTVGYQPFVNQGNRCPSCANYGYSTSKQGSFYIVKWTKDNHGFIKFGITNREIEVRIEEQSKNTHYTYEIIFQSTWEDGHIALNIENHIKSSKFYNRGIIDKCEFEDGFTETLVLEDLDNLISCVYFCLNNPMRKE